MFPSRMFPDRMFAPRFFPKVGEDPPVGVATPARVGVFPNHWMPLGSGGVFPYSVGGVLLWVGVSHSSL